MAADLRVSIAHQTAFALRLAAALSSPAHPAGGAGRNVAFSPLSLHVALSLVAAGAGGATRDQLASALGGPGSAEGLHAFAEQLVQLVLADASGAGGPRVAFADGVFVDASLSLKKTFGDVAVGKYKAETHSVDFQTKWLLLPSNLANIDWEHYLLLPSLEKKLEKYGKIFFLVFTIVGIIYVIMWFPFTAILEIMSLKDDEPITHWTSGKAAEVASQVNSWVEKVTSGLIKEILPPGSVDHTTRLVLGNALYFKGAWTEKFDASKTKDGEFHLLDGKSVQAPFMSTSKKQYISSYDNLKVLKLPYQQGGDKRQFSMYILLPEAQDGLWSLAEKLNSEPEFLEKHIPTRQVTVGQFKLPKFKISFGFEASDLLKSLGLHLPFSSEADLTEMVDSPEGKNLFVSSVFHKSFVEVNEEGTEAAAATAAVITLRSAPIAEDFVADHPFLFLIREDMTGVVLFVGHVAAEVLGQVNSWVDRVTSGLIKNIATPRSINHNTKLVLANALYFKGAWAEKFDVSKTEDGEFHLLDGESVQAPFMSTRKKQYLSSYDSLKVLKLPYLQGGDKRQFSMYILLPEAQDGLWSLAEKLNSEPEFMENHIPMRPVHVGQFKLPKFKISFGFGASGLLKGLGLPLLFGSEVDLIKMVDSPGAQNLFVSSVFHKSFIEVNEEGTEATAAVMVSMEHSRPRRLNFVADHPFMFLIREDVTGVILFIGHVL
uniref:Serpin domain-containing protein n=1 Tax=Oryza glumipatula TaxID=40148 RepID=A0A0D9ZAH6_9ORYZ